MTMVQVLDDHFVALCLTMVWVVYMITESRKRR